MRQHNIDYIKQHRKHPIGSMDWWRYFILFFPGSILFLGLMIFISEGITKPFIFVWPTIVAIGLYLLKSILEHIERDRKFYSIFTNVSDQAQIADCLKTLGWRLLQEEPTMVVAETKISLFSWGEVVTIIIADKELFVNSRPSDSPISSGRDIKNFWQFYEQVELKEKQLQVG